MEAINIKTTLAEPELEDFKASEGWLEKWKLTQGIQEKQISGESIDVCETTVKSCMEKLRPHAKAKIWKIFGICMKVANFWEHFQRKGYLKKERKPKVESDHMAVAFFVSADGGKAQKPIVTRKSKKPRCILQANTTKKILQVLYFLNRKSWMQVGIMKDTLVKLNQKIIHQERYYSRMTQLYTQ